MARTVPQDPLEKYRGELTNRALGTVQAAWRLTQETRSKKVAPLAFYDFWVRAWEEVPLTRTAVRYAWMGYQFGLKGATRG